METTVIYWDYIVEKAEKKMETTIRCENQLDNHGTAFLSRFLDSFLGFI